MTPYTLTVRGVEDDEGEKYVITRDEIGFIEVNGSHMDDELNYFPPVLAMYERIVQLEAAIRNVTDGTLQPDGTRARNALRSYGTSGLPIPLREWEAQLRKVLEQK